MTSRRDWMKTMTLGMAGLLASERVAHAQAPSQRALLGPRDPLKITRLEIIPVNSLRTIFVKMHTDAGIIGIGEGTVEGRIGTVVAAIRELEPYLIGKDPRQPAHHWQAIYRHAFYRGDIVLTSALSAVDIAMWDIKGKGLGTPVYDLLGGPTRDRIRVYGQAENVEDTRKLMAEGYTSMKTSVSNSRGRLSRYSENPDFIQGFVEKVEAIRGTIGPKFDLGIEMHADHQPQTAMVIIKALEKFQPSSAWPVYEAGGWATKEQLIAQLEERQIRAFELNSKGQGERLSVFILARSMTQVDRKRPWQGIE